jgi:thiosulfate/3-mercaptopyruvate sulfurtransferase
MKHPRLLFLATLLILFHASFSIAQNEHVPASSIPTADLIQPADLAASLQSASPKPLILQVGSHVLFAEAHIPGSEYAGPTNQPAGIQSLKDRVASLPKDTAIVLYCGCCPWERCPNIAAAYNLLHTMGFTNLKVLYIVDNFGSNWVAKGYPVAKGRS